MKQALIVGGGTGKGALITNKLLDNGYAVINLGTSEHPMAKNIVIDWKTISLPKLQPQLKFEEKFDFVFFNQNSSALAKNDFDTKTKKILDVWQLIKDWNQSVWLSCQLPFLILHSIKLNDDAKIGWMLSQFMKHDKNGNTDHPDYSSFKYFNFLQMKCFADKNNFSTFGIYPDFANQDSDTILSNIIDQVLASDKKIQEFYFN